MGGHVASDATVTTSNVAARIGRKRVLPVSSMARIILVSGARTTEAKKAAIPMMASRSKSPK